MTTRKPPKKKKPTASARTKAPARARAKAPKKGAANNEREDAGDSAAAHAERSAAAHAERSAAAHAERSAAAHAERSAAAHAERSAAVDAFMRTLTHPFKAEMQAVREIVLGANDKMRERIKWKVPSFFYRRDFGAFHPRNVDCVHLVLVFPPKKMVRDPHGLLEGDYVDRRMLKLASMKDIRAKRAALVALVNEWVALVDAS